MFNIGQQTAVVGAFKLAGYHDDLVVAPIADEAERVFLLAPEAFGRLTAGPALEQILSQLLGCKVWVVEISARWGQPIPFE